MKLGVLPELCDDSAVRRTLEDELAMSARAEPVCTPTMPPSAALATSV